MPRYFFHIKDEQKTIRDTEGAEFQNMDAVREEATESAHEMMSGDVRQGHRPNGRTFVITDGQGNVVLNFPFELAIRD